MTAAAPAPDARGEIHRVRLRALAQEYLLIGSTGFGGNLGLLVHKRVVERRGWMDEAEFAAATEAAAIAPGGTSTALLVGVARRLGGVPGVIVGMICVLAPGALFVIALLSLYQTHQDERWVRGLLQGAAAGGIASALAFLYHVWRVFGSSWIDLAGGAAILVAALLGVPVPVVLALSVVISYAVVTAHAGRARPVGGTGGRDGADHPAAAASGDPAASDDPEAADEEGQR